MRDPKVEETLDELGVQWEYTEAFPIADIDREASLHNQGRTKALDDDKVLRIAASLEAGRDEGPATVGRNGTGPAVATDGNHRLEAHRLLDRETISAYVCTVAPDSDEFRALTFAGNARNGDRNDDAAAVSHALWWVDQGETRKAAALKAGITESQLRYAVWETKALTKAERAGIPAKKWKAVQPTNVRAVANLDGPVFVAAANAVVSHPDVSVAEVAAMATAVRQADSERQKLTLIEEHLASWGQPQPTKAKRVTSPWRIVRLNMQSIIQSDIGAVERTLPSGQRDEYLNEIAQARTVLTAIERHLLERG